MLDRFLLYVVSSLPLRRVCAWGLLIGCATLLLAAPGAAQERLTLEEALDLARAQNFDIQIATNEVGIARNNVSYGNAGFWPSVSLRAGRTGTLTNTTQQFLGQPAQERDGAETTRYTAGVALDWTVFDGLSRLATYDRLQAQRAQADFDAEATVEQVIAEVTITYYDLVRQQQQLEVFRQAVAISEERLAIAELQLDVGSGSAQEVRQARVDLNTDRANLLRQQTDLANAKARFNQILARASTIRYAVAPVFDLDTTLAIDALEARALQQNATLQRAQQSARVARLGAREIRSERYPTVDLSLGYQFTDLTSESGFLQSSRANDFTYGVSVSLDLFDGFNRLRRVQNAQVQERNARLVVEDVRTQLRVDLQSLYESYQNRLTLVRLERENVGMAQQNVDVALERFRLGTITSVELREVQEALTRAESRLIAAQFEAKQAETQLRQLSGQLDTP